MQPCGRLDEILSVLSDACTPSHLIAGESDVETRLACVESIIELAERLPLTVLQRNTCFEILLRACGDYKTDKRGDTGSWCRTAAVQGMERLLYVTFRNEESYLRKSDPFIIGEPSKEHSSSIHGKSVMTSFGLGYVFNNDENDDENNDNLIIKRTGRFIRFDESTLGFKFATNSFQVHNLPDGVLLIHNLGVKTLDPMGSEDVSFPPLPPPPLPLKSYSAETSVGMDTVNDRKENPFGSIDRGSNSNNGDDNDNSNRNNDNDDNSNYDHDNNIINNNDNNNNNNNVNDNNINNNHDDNNVLKDIVRKVISAILKQLSEKLDSVRDVAGRCLERILSSTSPTMPYVPERKSLEKGILRLKLNKLNENDLGKEKEKEKEKDVKDDNIHDNSKNHQDNENIEQANISTVGVIIDWSQPSFVFPFVVNDIMGEKNSFFSVLFSGLLIAVGGLSEAIVKESSSALLNLCSKWNKENDLEGILALSNCLLFYLRQNKFDDRVIIPLLKTTEILLKSGILGNTVLRPVFSTFYSDLIELINVEQKRTNDVGKLRTCVDLYLLLLQIEDPVRTVSLKSMILMLGHKVRTVHYSRE